MRASLATGAAAFCALALFTSGQGPGSAAPSCDLQPPSRSYIARTNAALRARQDVWGNELLASDSGPTYEGAARYLAPLFLARAARGARLTDSGAHYVAFSGPVGVDGSGSMALHVADGSQIVAQRSVGRKLTLGVGANGRERYGSCLGRLAMPALGSGYLPILKTRYVDGHGVRYFQESLAWRVPGTRALLSLVRLEADARGASGDAIARFAPSTRGLEARGNRLVRGDETELAFGDGGRFDGSAVVFHVPRGGVRTIHVASFNSPARARELELGETTWKRARDSLTRYWNARLAEGMHVSVPERRVRDAYRALAVQDLALSWRYSAGNPYQQFSYPEGIDVAQVLAAHGFEDVSRAILARSLTQAPTRYPNWKIAQKLVGSALHYRLHRDRAFVARATPVLRGYLADLARQLDASPRGLLARERFSSDIKDSVFGLHTQAVAWQGLVTMADVWAESGHASPAAEARRLAALLERGLRRAVRESQRRLPDGSLFLPARLLDGERPYDWVTQTRAGGYWNLVVPYALASGLFAPGSPQAEGAWRYLQLHGGRMLGVVRAGVYSLYGLEPRHPQSGVNPVYVLNAARFLADNDRADELVLGLYGQLAAAMAPGTFVAGEGISVAQLEHGERFRTMFLPPNAASNASFMETLRLLLVHETRDRLARPAGLQLAFATPRGWLEPGKEIAVRRAPTSFGEVSYTLRATDDSVLASVELPTRARPALLQLRLRLPGGRRIAGVTLGGRPYRAFDAATGTIRLPTAGRRLVLTVSVA